MRFSIYFASFCAALCLSNFVEAVSVSKGKKPAPAPAKDRQVT